MTLGMAYYNSSMAVWEPIIEPNEREKSNGLSEYGPWELNFNLKIEKNLDDNSGQGTHFNIALNLALINFSFSS